MIAIIDVKTYLLIIAYLQRLPAGKTEYREVLIESHERERERNTEYKTP